MALILMTFHDTEEGLEFKVSAEPGIDLESETMTPAQALALVAVHAVTKAAEQQPDEEE